MTIQAALKLPKPVTCPATMDDLVAWIERALITFEGSTTNFGATEPDESGRAVPWIKTDSNRNVLGVYTYSATHGKWVRDWGIPVGGLQIVYRTAVTIKADREDKDLLTGWELADGEGVSGLNLKSDSGYFKGTAPEYDIYTLLFVGYDE